MGSVLTLVKAASVLLASLLLGNWFMTELKKNQRIGGPWYRPYVSAPGILVILAVMLPFFVWWLRR
jgi:hypothetical protein